MQARHRSASPSASTVAEQGVTQRAHRRGALHDRQARLLTLKAAWMMDVAGNKAAKAEIAMIKVVAPNMACQVIDWAMQVHGGGGVCEDFPLAYAYAHARTLRFADGPDEVHRNAIAKMELGTATPDAARSRRRRAAARRCARPRASGLPRPRSQRRRQARRLVVAPVRRRRAAPRRPRSRTAPSAAADRRRRRARRSCRRRSGRPRSVISTNGGVARQQVAGGALEQLGQRPVDPGQRPSRGRRWPPRRSALRSAAQPASVDLREHHQPAHLFGRRRRRSASACSR